MPLPDNFYYKKTQRRRTDQCAAVFHKHFFHLDVFDDERAVTDPEEIRRELSKVLCHHPLNRPSNHNEKTI